MRSFGPLCIRSNVVVGRLQIPNGLDGLLYVGMENLNGLEVDGNDVWFVVIVEWIRARCRPCVDGSHRLNTRWGTKRFKTHSQRRTNRVIIGGSTVQSVVWPLLDDEMLLHLHICRHFT